MKRLYTIVFFLFALATGMVQAQNAENGATLFKSGCNSCHSVGKGKIVGPDLKDVHTRRKEEWLLKFISSPGKMLNSGDETAKKLFEENNKILMPDHTFLKEQEIKDILAYLKAESTAQAAVVAKEEPKVATTPVKEEVKKAAVEAPLSFSDYFLYTLLVISLILLLFAFLLLYQVYQFTSKEAKQI